MYKLLLFAVIMAGGQLLFKKASESLSGQNEIAGIMLTLMVSPAFITALFMYAISTVLWVVILKEIPLSRAYPFTALAFVLVPVGSSLIFGERLEWRYGLGLSLILFGLFILSSKSEPAIG